MKQIDFKFNIALLVFVIGIILSFLTLIIPGFRILYLGIFVISLLYLILGWHLFKGYFPEGNTILLFFFGYLYSGVFIATVFYGIRWPLTRIFVNISPVWAIILLALIFMVKNKMPKRCFIQLIIEASILLVLSILLIIFLK